MRIDPAIIAREVEALLAAHPELADDEALRLDTVEGETSAIDAVRVLWAQIEEDLGDVEKLAHQIEDRERRQARLRSRVDAAKHVVLRIIEAIDAPVVLPEATISTARVPPKVVVTDESLLPDQFLRRKVTVAPDLRALAEALKRPGGVAGAHLSNGGSRLNVRTR